MMQNERSVIIDVSQGYEASSGDASPYSYSFTFYGANEKPPEFVHSGTLAWMALHSYRGCDESWLKGWEKMIPSGGCGCVDGYKKFLEELPPDFSTGDAFFAWGVNLHNAVNRKLNKPEISLEQAFALWRSTNGSVEDQKAGH